MKIENAWDEMFLELLLYCSSDYGSPMRYWLLLRGHAEFRLRQMYSCCITSVFSFSSSYLVTVGQTKYIKY